jgi:hypothetical protein
VLLRRLSILLIMAFCPAAGWSGDRSLDHRAPSSAPAVAGNRAVTMAIAAPTRPRPSSFSPFSPWRYRLKSVLPESDSRIDREVELGPLPLPGRSCSAVVSTSKSGPSRTVVPLRC